MNQCNYCYKPSEFDHKHCLDRLNDLLARGCCVYCGKDAEFDDGIHDICEEKGIYHDYGVEYPKCKTCNNRSEKYFKCECGDISCNTCAGGCNECKKLVCQRCLLVCKHSHQFCKQHADGKCPECGETVRLCKIIL